MVAKVTAAKVTGVAAKQFAAANVLDVEETRVLLGRLGIDDAPNVAAAYEADLPGASYAFHEHRKHQLLYAMSGIARVESETVQYLLPPQRVAWIPAGVSHATHVETSQIVSLYFAPSVVDCGKELVVMECSPVLREMILFARRWTLHDVELDALGQALFSTIGQLVRELATEPKATALPQAKTDLTQRAISALMASPDIAGLEELAQRCGASSRTLRRRLTEELGVGFRELLCQVRVHRAATLLTTPDLSISQIAMQVGFASPSAFSQTFLRVTGMAPSEYRKRLTVP